MKRWDDFGHRCWKVVKEATPAALKTTWWMVRVTVSISFLMFVLQWCGVLGWFSVLLGPMFHLFGLPGEAAFAYLSGYFINVYGCVAGASTLGLGVREMTILGTMTLATHAMIVESEVQHKTGSPLWQPYVIRTIGAFTLGIILNLILPGKPNFSGECQMALSEVPFIAIQGAFLPAFLSWGKTILSLVLKMVIIIYSLNVLQRWLREFGIMEIISKALEPVMLVFGLPRHLSFLWIIANVVGLSYGAAIMIDEANSGHLSKRDVLLLNAHIGISHSNIEDLLMVCTVGATWWIVMLSRWCMSAIVVWIIRGGEKLKLKLKFRVQSSEFRV